MAAVITCRVTVEIKLDGELVQQREWPAVDIMKTSVTRAWATRQFNKLWKAREPDKHFGVYWSAQYGEAQGHTRISGSLTGVNRLRHRRGVFEH